MSRPVALLAGGLATRLRPVTESIPKALVDVAGRPFAVHQIELLHRHGLGDIVLLVGHLGEMVRDVLGDGSQLGVSLRYAFDGPRQLGTGGAIRAALDALGDSFFVLYGDAYLECDYAAAARHFDQGGAQGLMTVYRNENRWDRSNVEFVDGRIRRYDKERPTPGMRHIDYGLGLLRSSAFDGRPAATPFDLADLYRDLLARDELLGFEVPHRFYEIGSPAGLAETRRHLGARGATTR